MAKKPYIVLKRKWLHHGKRLQFCLDTIQVPGRSKTYTREVIFHPEVAVIVPRLKNGNFILIRQLRYGVAKYLWEFPAGTCDGKESPLSCAKRELIEETHFQAKKFEKLISFYPTPGVSTELMHVFLAEMLSPKRGVPDEDEVIEVEEFTPKQVLQMVTTGKIEDAKTLVAFLYLLQVSPPK
ncbi:MAG: NUDIX hydrolase [Candidatus Omnitrophica bacterium]|nr:NUDIX hydrolase [Candidatus Omnitrophota bacterium]